MATWLVLSLIGSVVFVGALLLRRLEDEWCDLPHWVYNKVGGMMAICAVSDFAKGRIEKGYRFVPETIYYPEDLDVVVEVSKILALARHEPKLFVPFASEGLMPYDQQEKLFIAPPADFQAFMAAKAKANRAADARLRLCSLMRKHSGLIDHSIFFAPLITLLCFTGVAICFLNHEIERAHNAPTVFYTTTVGSSEVSKRHGTAGDLDKLPMTYSNSYVSDTIVSGPITDAMPLGGGLDYVCLRRTAGFRMCGFAVSGSLRVGDTGYLREGSAKLSIANSNGSTISPIRWAITEPEVEVLLKEGFRLEHLEQ